MSLECLLLTQDTGVLKAISLTFAELGIGLIMRQDAGSAIELIKRRHLDGFVIDCDDVAGGMQTIRDIRGNPPSTHPVVIAIVNGTSSTSQALGWGANFVMAKPVEESRLGSMLGLALPTMQGEHRRYFRYPVNLPIELQLLDGRCVRATMVNISQGGMAIQVNEALPKVSVRVRFGLPGVTTQKFEARTVLVWTNKASAGLQFIHIEAHGRENFERWLNSLEAQLQFRVFATQPNHS